MASKQIYQLLADNPLTPALTDAVPFQPNDAGATEAGANTWQEVKNLLQPYNIYRALVSQASTGDPTLKVLQNDLGGAVTIRRASAGTYVFENVNNLFTTDKVFASPKWGTVRQSSSYASVQLQPSNTLQLALTTYLNGTAADDLLSDYPVEILVYL